MKVKKESFNIVGYLLELNIEILAKLGHFSMKNPFLRIEIIPFRSKFGKILPKKPNQH